MGRNIIHSNSSIHNIRKTKQHIYPNQTLHRKSNYFMRGPNSNWKPHSVNRIHIKRIA